MKNKWGFLAAHAVLAIIVLTALIIMVPVISSAVQLNKYDVNEDNEVNIMDVSELLNYLAGAGQEQDTVTGVFTLGTELHDGDKVVIYNPANGKALGTTKTVDTNYNDGVDVTPTNNSLTNPSSAIVFTVNVVDGGYTFTYDSKKLSMDTSYSSTPWDKANDVWTVTVADTDAKTVYISNNGREGYVLEWYSSKTYWSAYNKNTTGDLFKQNLYILHNDTTPTDPNELDSEKVGAAGEAISAAAVKGEVNEVLPIYEGVTVTWATEGDNKDLVTIENNVITAINNAGLTADAEVTLRVTIVSGEISDTSITKTITVKAPAQGGDPSTETTKSIVFGELGLKNGVQYSDPFDGNTFTVTFAGGGNDGKYYDTGSGIRVYGNGTITIAAKSGNITKIVITYDGSNKPGKDDVVNDVGTYDYNTGTWTGSASSVVFTRPSGSGHWRVQSIEVTIS